MADFLSNEERSERMRRIKSRGNRTTEQAMSKLFRKQGITGWRRHQPILGTPDFVFWRERLAVFVDGCFWHGCPRCYKRPASNQQFWDEKIAGNKARDRRVTRRLRRAGWSVMRVWEHELRSPESLGIRLKRMLIHAARKRALNEGERDR